MAGCLACGIAHADGERPDSVGVVTGMTFTGAPTAGLAGRFALAERFALDGQIRLRPPSASMSDGAVGTVGDLGLAWTITYGTLAARYGARETYPLRFDLIAGAAVVDGELAAAIGVALRARVARYVTVELAVRDELGPGRPIVPRGARGDEPWIATSAFSHVPEVQLAISLTAPHAPSSD